jgi:hypothetical protein
LSNTTAGNTDIGVYGAIESRYTGGSDLHPDVTVDTTAKTITFNTAGQYRVGSRISVSVAVGSTSAEAKITSIPGSFRSGTWYNTSAYSAGYYDAQVTLWTGFGSASGYATSYTETFLNVNAGDILGVRFGRTGDTATSLNLYAAITLGRKWT